MKPFIQFVVLLCMLTLSSCASLDTVTSAPKHSGIYKIFDEDIELVKAAVLASVQSLNINIKQTEVTPAGFAIYFTKTITGFSWGEVGRVLVTLSEGKTRVYVHSEKRLQTQISGTGEEDFANNIFSGVQEILNTRALK